MHFVGFFYFFLNENYNVTRRVPSVAFSLKSVHVGLCYVYRAIVLADIICID